MYTKLLCDFTGDFHAKGHAMITGTEHPVTPLALAFSVPCLCPVTTEFLRFQAFNGLTRFLTSVRLRFPIFEKAVMKRLPCWAVLKIKLDRDC